MEMNMLGLSGLTGMIILALDLWAIISIINSNRGGAAKVLWSLLVFFLPILGFLIWLVAGPRAARVHA